MRRIALYIVPALIGIFVIAKIQPAFASPIIPANLEQQATQTASAPNFNIQYGKVETVFNFSTDNCNDTLDRPDSPATALVDADGNVQLYTARVGATRKMIGPNLTDAKPNGNPDCHIMMNIHRNADPRMYEAPDLVNYGGEWITAPYTFDGTTIWGLTHTEFHGSSTHPCSFTDWNDVVNKCWWNSVNLVKSTNKGYDFNLYPSPPPSQNVANTSMDFDGVSGLGMTGMFNPTNIIEKDGYLYSSILVRFPTTDPRVLSCMARIDKNKLDDPNAWRFWNGTDFSLPTKGVPAIGNCVFTPTWIVNDIHWDSYLNKYISIYADYNPVYAASPTQPMVVETGTDLSGAGWTIKTLQIDPNAMKNLQSQYLTLLQPGAETRNFEDIGRSPWLYYVTCQNSPDCTWPGDGITIGIKRVRVRFYTPGVDDNKYDVLDLHFNEYAVSKKTLDSSFYGNDGLLYGGAALGPNKYIYFDGTGWVDAGNDSSLNLGTDVSIEARIKTTQNPAAGTFPIIVQKAAVGGGRNYGLFLENGGKAVFSFTSSPGVFKGGESNRIVNDDKWHDILVTYTGSTGRVNIYIDGILDNSVTSAGPLSGGINSANLTAGNQFIGYIDKLTVYNYPLPAPAHQAGDYTGDSHVNMDDYNTVKNNFGHPYTIFDYNDVVANFGQ